MSFERINMTIPPDLLEFLDQKCGQLELPRSTVLQLLVFYWRKAPDQNFRFFEDRMKTHGPDLELDILEIKAEVIHTKLEKMKEEVDA